MLLGLDAIVALLAVRWHGEGTLVAESAAWYAKGEPTFSVCLAWTRQKTWRDWDSRVHPPAMTWCNCRDRSGRPRFKPCPERREAKVQYQTCVFINRWGALSTASLSTRQKPLDDPNAPS